MGTSEVESLPSYLHRLAYKHGIYVGELLRYCYRQLEEGEELASTLPFLPHYIGVHSLLRNNGLARGIQAMLSHMTRQPLIGSTISLFNGPLTLSRGELYQCFRWCPECFSEMKEFDQECYFKLTWQLRALLACPVHRTPFLTACDFCGCDQMSYIKKQSLGWCQECGKSLAKRKRRLNNRDLALSWQDIGRDVVELFRDIATYGNDSLTPTGIFQSLDHIFDYYWRAGREAEFYQLLSRDQLLSVIHFQRTLCLNDARKVAFGLGVSLYVLISGNAAQVTQVLDFDHFCPFPPSFMETSSKFKRDHRAILKKLARLLKSKGEPLSLKATAAALDVSVGYLRYRVPEQVRQVVDRHQAFIEEKKLKNKRLAQSKALAYFAGSAENLVSRKQAYRVIREETGLPKWMLKDAIRSAYITTFESA